jgi:hypothetical protein
MRCRPDERGEIHEFGSVTIVVLQGVVVHVSPPPLPQ